MGKNWIAGAIKKPGALRESLVKKYGKKAPFQKGGAIKPDVLREAARAPGKMGQRARLAQTLKSFR